MIKCISMRLKAFVRGFSCRAFLLPKTIKRFQPDISSLDHCFTQICDKRIELHFDDLGKMGITNQHGQNELMVSQQYFLLK
jgi:hypothetical protein